MVSLLDDAWDQDLYTLRPKVVADAVQQVREDYPKKRIVAHFIQTHYPFIAELGQRIQQGGDRSSRRKG